MNFKGAEGAVYLVGDYARALLKNCGHIRDIIKTSSSL
jgi:hypothetical protein